MKNKVCKRKYPAAVYIMYNVFCGEKGFVL